uniref:Mitochondrial GTPase n=1 Tax=Mycena chlorophos TaxID=658473 RepID=A0ABQ0L7B0_MYCCL|nr:mitochondrial GTPase [Mycena chlorophos]
MTRFFRQLPALLSRTNVVLEVRDARLPLTSINPRLESAIQTWRMGRGWSPSDPGTRLFDSVACERIVVFNKRDLVPVWGLAPFRQAMDRRFRGQQNIFASCQRLQDIRRLHEQLVSIANRYPYAMEMNVLVVGMPNVGKSTLLNSLRSMGFDGKTPKALRTSANPGLTQALSTRLKLSLSPPVYAFDSPGVMLPFMGHGTQGAERGVKLALIAGIKEGLYDVEALALYLLYKLNKLNPTNPAYLELLPPGTLPINELETFLDILAERMGMLGKGGVLDRRRAAQHFVLWWRGEGNLLASSTSFTPKSSSALRISAPSAPQVGSPGALTHLPDGALVEATTQTRTTGHAPPGWGFDLEWELTQEEMERGLSPQNMQLKMEDCIESHVAQMKEEESSENNVSVTQRRKQVITERKAKIAAKAKAMTTAIRAAEARRRQR